VRRDRGLRGGGGEPTAAIAEGDRGALLGPKLLDSGPSQRALASLARPERPRTPQYGSSTSQNPKNANFAEFLFHALR
jgi:hypothetical protein